MVVEVAGIHPLVCGLNADRQTHKLHCLWPQMKESVITVQTTTKTPQWIDLTVHANTRQQLHLFQFEKNLEKCGQHNVFKDV